MSWKKAAQTGLFLLGGAFLFIQFLPYGREQENPPVSSEPPWDTPATRATFMRSCADCHSNETKWPWYSNVAPISWLIQSDVEEGRGEFNVSEWGRAKNHGDEAVKEVRSGKMPLPKYLRVHRKARLSPSEKEVFLPGLRATFGEEEED